MIERLAKTALVAAVGLILLIIAINNLIDYGSNFEFVKHVLSMDTTFPDNRLKGRALTSPVIHHVFYAGIIAWEILSALGAWAAAFRLWHFRKGSSAEFAEAKSWTVGALVFNLLLWFVAFTTIGGEWFVMWQSHIWNGQEAAFRMFTSIILILLFVKLPEASELTPAR
jgi:predicted small integral membrane protein